MNVFRVLLLSLVAITVYPLPILTDEEIHNVHESYRHSLKRRHRTQTARLRQYEKIEKSLPQEEQENVTPSPESSSKIHKPSQKVKTKEFTLD
jgi:glucan-binding YG repeat protein